MGRRSVWVSGPTEAGSGQERCTPAGHRDRRTPGRSPGARRPGRPGGRRAPAGGGAGGPGDSLAPTLSAANGNQSVSLEGAAGGCQDWQLRSDGCIRT